MKASFLLFVVCLGALAVCNGGRLRNNFYRKSCPLAEDIVRKITERHVVAYPVLPAKLLRLHFHDCFVRGCDASVLLNSTANNKAEKDAIPNLSLAGFDVIDEIKAQLEETCPGVVSCADIVALSARDSVSFQYKRSMWKVRTGRRPLTTYLALSNSTSPASSTGSPPRASTSVISWSYQVHGRRSSEPLVAISHTEILLQVHLRGGGLPVTPGTELCARSWVESIEMSVRNPPRPSVLKDHNRLGF